SYHPVDSSEMSFKMAASVAYKEGLPKANPVILEPIGKLTVTVPERLMGDVMGDIPKRRGTIINTSSSDTKKGFSVIEAEVPQSEMSNYSITIRAMSQGRGSFTYDVTGYSEVPAAVAQKIIDDAANSSED
ncbi:MAG: elongation factor G, partial [Firmicutes bacterium]|nr:elongation factor G [Bacillota bacterium]